MNKKQAAIIVTLLALIVCAGILATKASTGNPFYVNVNDVQKSASPVNTTKAVANVTNATTSTFAEMRLVRDKNDTNTIETLKAIVDDTNTPTAGKNDASMKMTSIVTATRLESIIEQQLQLSGLGDIFCYLDGNTAKVIINSKTKLNENQTKEINSVVMDVANVRDVTIEVKQ